MAEREAAGYRTIRHAGEYGNACLEVFEGEFAADAAATVLQLGKLSGAITITQVVAKTDDMGDAQTMDIGYRYLTTGDGTSDPDGLFDGIDTGTAAAVNTFYGPLEIADGDGIELVASNIGAAATGTIVLIVSYKYNGQ